MEYGVNMAALENRTFTLTLKNTCLTTTYMTVYFKLNNGTEINMSRSVVGEANATFAQTYSIDPSIMNTLHVTGDYIGNFIYEPPS